MIQRLTRIIGSLGAVIALYWVYALLAVPFIEPSVNRADGQVNPDDVERAAQSHENQMKALNAWFAEGDWERTSPKILETSQGMLLVKNYTNLGEGRVQIVPCSMIFLPEGNFTEEERQRRAIVLRSPQGAILQFDAFDLKQAKVGKLIAGKLLGPVTIRSDQRDPGPQDDLLIQTRDMDMTEQRFQTPESVEFQIGSNYGHGRAMQIDMAPQGSKRGFRGMTRLQLFENVEMHILPSGHSGAFPGTRTDAAATPATAEVKKANPPIEIRCRGPFNFDFLKNVATFQEDVDVVRLNQAGPSDQLTCRLLTLFFEPAPPRNGTPVEADKTASNLQPVRVEATGNPVIIHAQSSGMQARCQNLEYLFKTGAIALRGEPEAVVEQNGREMHCREIHYQPESSGRIGPFTATGQGWVRSTQSDNRNPQPANRMQKFEASWNRRLYFRPYEGNYLLSLEGGAVVNLSGKGSILAEEIYLWLRDTSPPAARDKPAGENRQQFAPDRMQAVGHVKIDSPQLTGEVGQLQAWFETIAAPVAAAASPESVPVPAAREPVPQPAAVAGAVAATPISAPLAGPPSALATAPQPPAQPPAVPPGLVPPGQAPPPENIAAGASAAPGIEPVPAPAADLPPQQRFHITGELLRTRVKLHGNVSELSDVDVEHNVRLVETHTKAPDEKPLLVMGRLLHMTLPKPQDAIVMVTGEPSYVEARGITMTSQTIHLDRGQNILRTDSEGAMTFPLDRDADGRPVTVPQLLNVTWQGQMHFDGQMAHFDRHVIAEQGLRRMTTELLEVLLNRRLQFGSAASKERPEVDRVFCRQGVLLENRTLEGQRLMSIDKLQAVEMTLHQPTGDVEGLGPGWTSSVRFNANQRSMAAPGRPAKPAAAPRKPSASLTYIGVEFQRGFSGNVRRHQMRFDNQVQAVYGPVSTWQSQLDPDQPETWGEEGALLFTDRLIVTEIPAGPEQRWFELEALGGNTSVENSIYRALGNRITYDQAKDLLVLEGDGRNNAHLYRQLRVGAASSEAAARKILYWPSTNRVQVDEANMLDLTMPPSSK